MIYLKRRKINCQGKAPLFLRVSIGNDRAEIALRRSINPSLWDNKKQSVKGRNEEAKSVNAQIEAFKLSVQNHYTSLIRNGEEVSAQSLKLTLMGMNVQRKSLVQAFNYHNLKIKEMVGKGYAIATFKRFETALKLIRAYLKVKFNIEDIFLHNINLEFITEFDFYLRVTWGCNNNTTVKYIRNLKKVINLALAMSWIEKIHL